MSDPALPRLRLTRHICQTQRIVFRPASEDEADEIVTRLTRWGVISKDAAEHISTDLMVARGFVIKDGSYTYNPLPSRGDVSYGADDFDGDDMDVAYIGFSQEGREMMRAFAQVMARQDRIERKLDRVLDMLEPKTVRKISNDM